MDSPYSRLCFVFSGGLDGEASAEGVDYLGDGLEAGVAVLAEALVEAFAPHARVLGDLGHAPGLGDVAERGLHECGVVVFGYGVEVGDDVLFVFEVFAGVVVGEFGAHCRCSL